MYNVQFTIKPKRILHFTFYILHSSRGFSLIESLLVIVIVGSIVFLMASIPNAMMLIGKSRHLSLAREIAAKQIEDKRTISYINLVNDNSPIADNRLSLLPSGAGNVVVENCSEQICTNGEHIKQVSVTITWKDNSKLQNVTLKTMIGEGGINQ
ncbi:prepilin-type N-terminal cleavage/methylation domain-containing protein [Candidatus Daviesbacteria bacterium]|nr:prepilin-type N-terminal cleavage/methylation domain-containing protein [Candidatus Daviesbacteria bacterium]